VLATAPAQLCALTVATVVVSLLNLAVPTLFPVLSLIIVLMVGGFLLSVRSLLLLYFVVAAALVFVSGRRTEPPSLGTWVMLSVAAVLLLGFARSREKLGVQGIVGEAMLIDLRDRLRFQGRIPALPTPWQAEATLRAAYGDSFSGDFLVSSLSRDNRTLRLALVDVSGKGQAAGTRALLLSGAFGGLIGALPAEGFLAAANAYLLRQRWDEGFATAVHFVLDMPSGRYLLAVAGHPPAAHYHAGSGSWELLREQSGPALGIIDDVSFPAHEGVVMPGDAILLYTDGLVETPGADVDLGIDRLIGQAERLVRRGFSPGGADWVVDATTADQGDDRALVLIWRS
jgi:hypothetical protein